MGEIFMTKAEPKKRLSKKIEKELARCMLTIRTLCELKSMHNYYYIGFTAAKAARFGSGRKGWKHVVVLADHMNRTDGLDLEEAIHNSISDNDHDDLAWKKYHPEKIRNGHIVTRRSSAGRKPRHSRCSIYMLWW